MSFLFSFVTLLSWALWLGGIVGLFISVQRLFAFSRPLAVEAAPVLFQAFERYQLFLAALAVIAAVGWMVSRRSVVIGFICAFLALAGAGAVASPVLITRKMEQLRAQQQSSGPEFRRLHGYSMMVYTAEAAALLGAGLFLPAALRRREPPRPPESTSTT